jgi:hypothetical protein
MSSTYIGAYRPRSRTGLNSRVSQRTRIATGARSASTRVRSCAAHSGAGRDQTGQLSAQPPACGDLHGQRVKYLRFVGLASQSAAVPRRSTSLSTGSVTRTASGTSRPSGRSSTTTRPRSTSTTLSTRCACGSSSRTTSPARRSRAATSSTGTCQAYVGSLEVSRLTPRRLLSVRDDPTAALRYPSFASNLASVDECAFYQRRTTISVRIEQAGPYHRFALSTAGSPVVAASRRAVAQAAGHSRRDRSPGCR